MGKSGGPSPCADYDSDGAASAASSSSGGSLFSFEAASDASNDAPPPPPVTENKGVTARVANVPVPAATTSASASASPCVRAEPALSPPPPPPPPPASESDEDVDWEDGDFDGGGDGAAATGIIEVVVPEDAEAEAGGEGGDDDDASPSGGKDPSKSPQRPRRGGGMPSIATARAVARSKRAALRRDLLVAAHAEHCTLLLLALARLRHRAATVHAAHSVAAHAAAAASARPPPPPGHRHRPADVDWAALPDGVRRVVAAHKAASATPPGPPLSLASTLQLHGHLTRPALGVGLDLAWNAYFRRVGRFFEAAADAAVLGRPPPTSHAVHIRRPKGAGGAPAGSYKVRAGGAAKKKRGESEEEEDEEDEEGDRSRKSSSASPRRGGTKRAAPPPPAPRGKKGAAKRARKEVSSSESDDSTSSSTPSPPPPPPSSSLNGKATAKGKKAATKKAGKRKSAAVLSDSSSTTDSSDSSSTTSTPSSSEDAGTNRPRGKKAAAAAAAAKKKKKKKEEEEFPMLSVSVDDLLNEENLTGAAAEHAVAAWNPAFLDHTPRNPVEAVIEAHRTERALYTSSAFAVDHAYSEHWWCEVFCPDGHWRPVDAPPHAPSLPYVFAAPARSGPGGGPYFVDATAKYAADFSAALAQRIECVSLPVPPDDEGVWEQMRQIEEGEDGSELSHPEQSWLRRTLALLNEGGCDPSLRVAAGCEEDALRRMRYRKRPPTAHKELVRHNLYCAASLLGKLEVLRQGAEPLARAHQYEIYTRDDVTKLRGREAWRRLGREVRPGERALRRVAAAAGFGGHVDPATGARLKEVFAHWQTARLRVPVTVSNGRISDAGPRGGAVGGSSRTGKDREGTVCIADGPLPDGLAHIRTSTPGVRLPALCSSLKIAYGKALVSFTRSGGFSRPNFNGVVVSNEDAPRLSLALAVVEKEKESVAARKKEGEVVQRWERLTLYLVTRMRLRDRYRSSS